MAYDVEDKVVQMRFDNREFDPNIDASIKSLEKLERSLKLADGTKGLENIEKSAKKISLNPAVTAVETLQKSFSTLEIVAITAISNITNQAMAMGSKIAKAFLIDPLKSGFGEYSEQMDSTQVILSNIAGSTLPQVTYALDTLNEYADRTIYSFGQMTQAIGKFAAAGVNLQDSTDAIQGLSSAAATVGASNQQLFSAYYNLAQALQIGKMQLIDWKSLENSTIGNKTMREAFIKTAIAMGKFAEGSQEANDAYSDFRGSLSKNDWLTSDVIIETLKKYSRQIKEFSEDFEDAYGNIWEAGIYEVDAKGNPLSKLVENTKNATGEIETYLTENGEVLQAWEVDLAKTAFKAATEVKSFRQMWDTLTEAVGTGWAETWKIIFGDLEQAKELWTGISKPLDELISKANEFRNTIFRQWDALGGRENLRDTLIGLSTAFANAAEFFLQTFDKLVGTTEIDGEEISNLAIAFNRFTYILKVFTEFLTMTNDEIEENSSKLAELLSPLRIIAKVLGFIFKVAMTLVVVGIAIAQTIGNILLNLSIIPELINEIFGDGAWEGLLTIFGAIVQLLSVIIGLFMDLGSIVVNALSYVIEPFKALLAAIMGVDEASINIGTFFGAFGKGLTFVVNRLTLFVEWLRQALFAIKELISGKATDLADIFGKKGSRGGSFFGQGVFQGLIGENGLVKKGAVKVAEVLENSFNKVLGIHSPAKSGIKSGIYWDMGVAKGNEEALDLVEDSGELVGETLAESTNESIDENLDKVQQPLFNKNLGISEFGKELEKTRTNLNNINNEADETIEIAEKQETVFERIGNKISDIWTNVKNFISNISVGQVLVIALSATIIFFIFKVASLLDDISDAIEGLGTLFKQLAFRITAEAIDQIAQALFNVAKAIALLVLIANFDPEGMKQAVVVLGLFIGVVSLIMFLFTRLMTLGQKIQSIGNAAKAAGYLAEAMSRVATIASIAIMVAAFSAGMMMLSNALKTLSEIDTKSLWKGLAVLTLLMSVFTALIIVLSRTMGKLNLSVLFIFGYVLALKLFSDTLSQIGEGLVSGIKKLAAMSKQEIIALVALVAALSIVSVCLNYASNGIAKVVLATSVLAVGLAHLIAAFALVRNNPIIKEMIDFLTDWKSVVIVCSAFAALAIITSLALNQLIVNLTIMGAQLTRVSVMMLSAGASMITFALSTGIILGAISLLIRTYSRMAGKYGDDIARSALISGIASIVVIFGALIGILVVLNGLSKRLTSITLNPAAFTNLLIALQGTIGALFEITGLMILVVSAMTLFWDHYDGRIGEAFLTLGTSVAMLAIVMGLVAGTMAVIGRNVKGVNYGKIAVILIPLIGLIGELMIALGIFTTFKPQQLIPGIIAIQAVMAPIIALIGVISILGKNTTKMFSTGLKIYDNRSVKTLKQIFNGVLSILIGASILIAEIAGMAALFNSDLVSVKSIATSIGIFATVFGLIIASIWAMTFYVEKLSVIANPQSMIAGLISFAALIGIVAIIIGIIGYTAYRLANTNKTGDEIAGILISFALVIAAAMGSIIFMMRTIRTGGTVLGEANGILAIITGLSLMIIALGGVIWVLKDIPAIEVGTKLAVLTATTIGLGGLAFYLNKLSTFNTNIGPVIVLLANLSGFIGLLAGISYLLKDLEFNDFALKIVVLTGAVAVLSGLVLGLSALTQLEVNPSTIYSIAATIVALSIAMTAFGGVTLAFSAIKPEKVEQVVKLLKIMGIAFLLLGGIAAGLGFAFKGIGGWSGLVIAFFAAMATVLLAFGAAVSMIANSKLSTITNFLDKLTDDSGKLTPIGKALWGIVGSMTALAIGLTLGGPGLLIAAAGFVALSAALYIAASAFGIFAESADMLPIILNNFGSMFEIIKVGIQKILGPMSAFLSITSIFAPVIVILMVAMTLMAGAFTLFIGAITGLGKMIISFIERLIVALGNLASTFESIKDTIDLFVDSVIGIADKVSNNLGSLSALGMVADGVITLLASAITKLGIALLIATPGLLGLAAAISVVIISIGVSIGAILALATPLIIGVTALVLVFKDAAAELLNLLIDRLPDVLKTLYEFTGSTEGIAQLGAALDSLGIGLLLIGAGAIVTALGIMALAGSLKVVDLIIKSFGEDVTTLEKFKELLTKINEDKGAVALFGGILAVLGLGLIVLGAGLIVASLGMLAFAGAAYVLKKNIGGFQDQMDRLNKLMENSYEKMGAIAGLGGVLSVLGLGLIVLGVGCIVAGAGLLILSGALSIMNAIGFDKLQNGLQFLFDHKGDLAGLGGVFIPLGLGLIALAIGLFAISIPLTATIAIITICLTVMAPALLIIAASVMIASLAFTLLSTALINLTSVVTGEDLVSLGIGMMTVAAGISALAIAMLLMSVPISILTVLIGLLMIVATVCTILLVPAISAISLALIPCIAAMTGLVTALSALTNNVDIMQLGLGILVLAAGFIALSAAAFVVSLVYPLFGNLANVLSIMNIVLYQVSDGLVYFTTAMKTAAHSISVAIIELSISIRIGVNNIIEAIREVMNLMSEGVQAAQDFVAGFANTLADSKIGTLIYGICEKLGLTSVQGLRDGEDAHSPSEATKQAAKDFIAGFKNTIQTEGIRGFFNACSNAGKAAVQGFKRGWAIESNKGGGIWNTIAGKGTPIGKAFDTIKKIWNGNFDWSGVSEKLGLNKIIPDLSDATTGLDNFSSGLGDVGTAAQTTKGTLEELTDTIKNQMDIFARFNDEDIIDPKELIHNMESQLRGIRNWANGIDVLASRGASGDLIKYLSELGPQGYKYVESFLEMTGDQFAKANSLFTESLSLPDEAANTLLDGYRKSGAEIIEAVDQGISSGGGAAAGSFNDVMTDIEDQSEATSKQVLDDAIKAGDLSVEAIRMAGEDAIWAYKDGLWSWFSSEDYANMTEEAKAALGEVWSGKGIMDEMMKTGDHVDTTKSLFDHRYLESLAASDRAFYIDGWGKAVTGSQYVAESIKKGYLLPAAISNKVTAAEIGDLLGKTAVEWNAAAIEAGEGDLATGIEVLFGSAYDKAYPEVISTSEEFGANASNAIWDGFSEASKANYDRIAEQTRQYYNNLNEFQEEWYTAMYDRNSDYNSKMQKEYDLMMAQQKQIANDLAAGLTTKEAYAKAAKSGDEAWKAYNNSFRKSAQINSPSKEMEINAQYLIQGLVQGIDKYMYMITNASEELANNPINAIADTITQISSLFTEDLDAAPTITPILDMSNVESGASELDTLFSTQQAQIAANANVRYTSDDSVNRLKAAYADVLSKSNAELINAIQNTEQPVNVNVVLQGDASTFFSAMVDQTRSTVASGGMNPFLITNRNSINAALV